MYLRNGILRVAGALLLPASRTGGCAPRDVEPVVSKNRLPLSNVLTLFDSRNMYPGGASKRENSTMYLRIVKDETTLDLSTSDDPVSARSNQEVAVEFGDETLESERTDNSKRQSTLLESIERVLNDSYEIVIEDQPKEE